MTVSERSKDEINQFAKAQALHYLDIAEMTYLEKVKAKGQNARHRAARKLKRFKPGSDDAAEVQNDLILYMHDYMEDMLSQGIPEAEALERAKKDLRASEQSDAQSLMQEKIMKYIEERDPATDEAIGLFYGGFVLLGLLLGALIGYLGGGGRELFLSGGWIDTLVGTGVGLLLGAGAGMISHGILVRRS